MPLSASELRQKLEESNTRLEFWLDSLNAHDHESPATLLLARPHQIARLLAELMRAGQVLRTLPKERDDHLEQLLRTYRSNVERLRNLLPSIHNALLAEKVHLEQVRGRVQAAAQWVERSQQTV